MIKTVSQKRVSEATYTAAECARHTGLTIKALRVYEREGLLKPMRTQKDWRVYGPNDVARLGEIIALRTLGLKLADIAKVLKGKASDINHMLELQEREVLRRRQDAETLLGRISALRKRASAGEVLTLQEIATTIREINMSQTANEVLAWKRYQQMRPRVAIPSTPQDLKESEGHHRLPDGMTLHIFAEGKRLMLQIVGQSSVELLKEAPDAWFVPSVSAQITFQRNSDGTITALTLHQHGMEMVAPRISAEYAKRLNEKLESRIARGEPHPDSQRLARTLIEHHIKGEPCEQILETALAITVAEQRDSIKQFVIELGALKSLDFLAVTPEGWDAYRASFEHGDIDMSVFIADSGKISGAWIEPPKAESFWAKLKQKSA